MRQPTLDAQWARMANTVGRLADKLDSEGREDLLSLLDFIEALCADEDEGK